jgi:hypothetical protein
MFDIRLFVVSFGNLLLARADARAGSLPCFGFVRLDCVAWQCACARVEWMRGGLPPVSGGM